MLLRDLNTVCLNGKQYQEAQANLLSKDDLLKQRETDLKDLKTKLEHVQCQLEQQISANQSRADERILLEQLKEQQQQFIHLKQLHENEKSDILLNQEEMEKKNRQNLENLREKLEIEKNALKSTMAEKDRTISKLNHELDEMRDNIQVWKSGLGWSKGYLFNSIYSRKCIKHINQGLLPCRINLRQSMSNAFILFWNRSKQTSLKR